ncbi:NAD(P) transhydrogenase [Deinococcus metalli]|uniref:NAD(P)(+) transhydrogenase (Si-specific) n=1 Tax=Deinococcus metalli TaxID=1141878 RepID=A0A7W8KIN4_9DEIO|nr:Si-specific NAD(P)(+) transhydrogenase [Deinococcus metalli]MBB5378865.1 NAD(P) transhydrogenase [Deinococcus metalli]GHF62276.1 NAD(P)(+) transhydrogenase [Deinococcus metalli]
MTHADVPADYTHDLLVIGSGPGGQRAAIQAAKLGKKVAVIERKTVVGGVCINTGTIPSKTFREAIMHLSGYNERGLYGASYMVKEDLGMDDLLHRTTSVITHELDVIRSQLHRNRVEVIAAEASFTGPHTLRLRDVRAGKGGETWREVSARHIVVAVGTRAARDPKIPFDGKRILISDDILDLSTLPRTVTVIGGGVIGCEYASMFAALGVRVTLIDKRPRLLEFIDHEITDILTYQLRQNRMTLRLGEGVRDVTALPGADGRTGSVKVTLASGKEITTDMVLYSIGRVGATDRLNLEAAGLSADGRGRIEVNEHYQTSQPHIYAVGDVIGFPSLASVSMEQGRLAACHAYDIPTQSVPELFPYGIYTIPEISTVGKSEEELTQAGVPYEIGKAQYREIARGQIIGDEQGTLKLIFHLETRVLLGVHIIGSGASELIHIGQAVMSFGGTVDYFVNTVFNYPTLAECYKTAAFDGINRLGSVPVLEPKLEPAPEVGVVIPAD